MKEHYDSNVRLNDHITLATLASHVALKPTLKITYFSIQTLLIKSISNQST